MPCMHTVWQKKLTGENIDQFDEYLAIRQNFTIETFLSVCM